MIITSPFRERLRHLVAAGLLLLWATCVTAVAGEEQRVLILGDSISAAYGLSLDQGWVALLEDTLCEGGADVRFINESISGETTAGGRRRLPALLQAHEPGAVIIELGGNDALRGYPIGQLRANLEAMVNAAQAAGAAVLLLPMEIPPNYGPAYTRAFRETFVTVAETTGARLGPFLLDDVATDPALMQSDGIHPTAAAQSRMAETARPAVEALLAP